jgi:hypothetical protein
MKNIMEKIIDLIMEISHNICTFILENFNSLFYSSFIMENMNKIFSLNSV